MGVNLGTSCAALLFMLSIGMAGAEPPSVEKDLLLITAAERNDVRCTTVTAAPP